MSFPQWLSGVTLSLHLVAAVSAQTVTPRVIIGDEEPFLADLTATIPTAPPVPAATNAPQPAASPTVQQLRKLADDVARMGLAEETAELRTLADRIEQAVATQLSFKQERVQVLEAELQALRTELAALRGAETSSKAQVRVHLVEISKDELSKLPIDWQHQIREITAVEAVGEPSQPRGSQVHHSHPDLRGQGLASREVLAHELSRLRVAKLVRVMAEPTLLAHEGRPAKFHSGGEFPILVPGGDGRKSIEFRQFGEQVEVLPRRIDADRWEVDIAIEHSERDFTNAVNVDGIQVPGLNCRHFNTRVKIPVGRSYVFSQPVGQVIDTSAGSAGKPVDEQQDKEKYLLTVISVDGIEETAELNPIPLY